MKTGRKALLGGIVALLLLAVAGFLLFWLQGGIAVMKQKKTAPPGTLAGLSYQNTGGTTMVSPSDFFIALSPEAIVETSYCPLPDEEDPGNYQKVTKRDVPITAEQWSDVERMVLAFYPELKPKPEKRFVDSILDLLGNFLNVHVQDGGDIVELTLTWRTEDGVQSIHYYRPDSSQFRELRAYLGELAVEASP